jgi:hypothetical protein
MRAQAQPIGDRYWVLGGRWVDGANHLPWPRVYGPYRDQQAARASADELNHVDDPRVRYIVVADVPDGRACDAHGRLIATDEGGPLEAGTRHGDS